MIDKINLFNKSKQIAFNKQGMKKRDIHLIHK